MTEHPSEQPQRITVAVDAMGGDQAPHEIVVGAVVAARAHATVDVVLVGNEATIRDCLSHRDCLGPLPANIAVQHASQVVEMCDAPGTAIRQKRDSSIAVGTKMVRDGQAHAMISAGNSGAMMAAAVLILKPQPGVDRPAIATLIPARHNRRVVLLDAGATTDCRPIHLVQFAQMGCKYAQALLDLPSPRVGLVSIGEEESKGDELTKETHLLLRESTLNFIGNVEPKEIVRGNVDVAVCDGFVGNLILKTCEGFSEFLMETIKEQIMAGTLSRLAALLLRPVFNRVRKTIDYAEYGGALLLGVNGVVVISHGRSNRRAIENAIGVAARAAERHIGESLSVETERDLTPTTVQ
ncbi:MAG: phosphate acyltransferase PlsX [Armatimonadota bacterium]